MRETVAIDGIKLDEVRMLLESPGNNTVSYLSYPTSQFRISRDGQRLRLVIPAYLAVELYRTGILSTDGDIPVEISIDGRSVGWYTVSDLRYPHHADAIPKITFAFAPASDQAADCTADERLRQPAQSSTETYYTDITHYLDETGELISMPGPARKLASFLTLLIKAATGASSTGELDSGVRCRKRSCQGRIKTVLRSDADEIAWHCPVCDHHGLIRNWQNTKWNRRKRTDDPE